MELPLTEAIQEAQKDLEERIREHYVVTGKNAVIHSMVWFAGVIGTAHLLARYFGEDSIVPMAASFFGGVIVLGKNLDKIGDYLGYLTYRKRKFAEDYVTIKEGNVVEIKSMECSLAYDFYRLASEPQEYLAEQLLNLQKNREEAEKHQTNVAYAASQIYSLETESNRHRSLIAEDQFDYLNWRIRIHLALRHWIRGATLRSSLLESQLCTKRAMATNKLNVAALNYGIEFYTQAKSIPEVRQYAAEIESCLSATKELRWIVNDLAIRDQHLVEYDQRFHSQLFPSATRK